MNAKQFSSRSIVLFSFFLAIILISLAASVPVVLAAPSSVTLAANFETALGCPGDWNPSCAAAHLVDQGNGVWRGEFSLPAQADGQYKMALNDSWTESYAGNHTASGNTTLVTNSAMTVRFYYDDKTHAVLDSVMDKIATVAGSMQSELGCPGDWNPACLRSLMVDPDGDGVYTFETTSLPAGSYEFKVARDEGWSTSYPQNNVPFTVASVGQLVRFYWDSSNNNVWVQAAHAQDNNVEWNGLAHDSRSLVYRTPGGAVPAGTTVRLRFRTFHNDVTSVDLRLYDLNLAAQKIVHMQLAAGDVGCYQADLTSDSCDFWEATVQSNAPDNFWYRFIVKDGTSTAFYADDTPALDGGLGAPTATVVDNSWALMFYDPKFKAPGWLSDAVIYQIFPDRFRNGDKSNDAKTGDARYDDPALAMKWSDLPEGYCRNYSDSSPETCPWRFDSTPPAWSPDKEAPRGRDYYGGDLQGVISKLDYLSSLGVNTIYFNPIFAARSNHRYDTADYRQIDRYLGTNADFANLVKQAERRNIRIILDGVFNHMSSDSPAFDRYHHYAGLNGACESATSTFRPWFTFRPPAGSEPAPCVPSTPGGNDTYYTGWFGFDSIPVLTKSLPAVQKYFVTGPDSISRLWLQRGADGWRLDVMGDPSFPSGYWESFRKAVKSTDSNAAIIGELWQKDSTLLRFLRGDRADTAMNYRFRDAMIGWLSPNPSFDSKGFADSGHPIPMAAVASRLSSIREDYPDAAYFSLMNLLDSHDTERALWSMTAGTATRADRELNSASLSQGKLNLRVASLVQFSLGGAPTIYYGDEVGVTGDTDPDDRRTYPWTDMGGKPDQALFANYQKLSQLRRANPVLRTGDFKVLMTDEASRTLAFVRTSKTQAALVIAGNGGGFQIPVAGVIPDGIQFKVAYAVNNPTGAILTVANGKLNVSQANKGAMLLLTARPIDLTPPAAPTGLVVTNEGSGQVSLSWNAVLGAAGYNVYVSPLFGGGWVKANSALVTSTSTRIRLPAKSFTVGDLRNAQTFYFIIRAVDAKGNESAPSNQATALPHLSIGWANLQWPPTMSMMLSVNPTDTAYGQVWIDGVTNQPGATPNLLAQLGYGPHASDPRGAGWIWTDAAFNVDAGNNDEFKAAMIVQAAGDYDYLYRYSTTNGRDWVYADQNGIVASGSLPTKPGRLTVTPSSDTTPPAVPTGLNVKSASPSEIVLQWNAVAGDPTLYGYEVLRSSTFGGPYTLVGFTSTTEYGDTTVSDGGTYYYVVRSVDTSWNRSGNSAPVQATAAPRTVTVVFDVTVPANTDASGKSVHIAGTLSRLDGGLPDWDPGAAAATLTRVDATHWTITLTGKETTAIEYKYALGSWDFVEKDAACGEINNRALTLTFGATGTMNVNDTVLNWRNSQSWGGTCGN